MSTFSKSVALCVCVYVCARTRAHVYVCAFSSFHSKRENIEILCKKYSFLWIKN